MRPRKWGFQDYIKGIPKKSSKTFLIIESAKLFPPLCFSPSLSSPFCSHPFLLPLSLSTETQCCSRARIKISCEKLRELVPGITLKTDKATVFEFAVEYLAFLKRLVGPQYDKVNIAMYHVPTICCKSQPIFVRIFM